MISTGCLKYSLELKKKFSENLELKKNFSENWKKNQLVYNWIFIPVWNECRNGYFKKPVEINRGLTFVTIFAINQLITWNNKLNLNGFQTFTISQMISLSCHGHHQMPSFLDLVSSEPYVFVIYQINQKKVNLYGYFSARNTKLHVLSS